VSQVNVLVCGTISVPAGLIRIPGHIFVDNLVDIIFQDKSSNVFGILYPRDEF
jgi:hypothetical protein